MGIKYFPTTRLPQGQESIISYLDFGSMYSSGEIQLTGATAPAIPTYDTAATGSFNCATQTGTGTTTNLWWVLWVVPSTYLAATNLTLGIDGRYVLTGDSVFVAATVDAEVFPYDSTNGDYSNTDINATAAQTLTTAFATYSFTLTGTSIVVATPLLIRFTSVIQITSAGGAGTGYDQFNFARMTFTGRE